MNTFKNKVVVVTGGNSGMGLAAAKELSRLGAKVVISGRDEKTLAAAAASIGGEILAVRADVARLGDLDDLFARTKKKFGAIDVLFVNAGIAKFAPFEQTTEALHDEILDINFKGDILHHPEGVAAAQGRRVDCHQHVGCFLEGHAERERLCGEQGGAAVVDPDAGGGTARSQDSGERRRPRPDLDAHLRANGWISRGSEETGGRVRQWRAHEACGYFRRGRQGGDLPRFRRCLVHHRRRIQRRWRQGPTVTATKPHLQIPERSETMNTAKILITGATGDTGGYAIEQLLQKGRQVRALVHRPDDRSKRLEEKGVEVVAGDYLDLDAMRAAVQGVRRAYFVYPIRPGIIQATAYFAQAAREAGVEAIVNMSQISAREDAKSHAARDHWVAERVFDWSGIAVTHLRPTFFAEWLLYYAALVKAGMLHVPLGTGKHAPVAAEDQALVIVAILENPASHRGKVYPLFGSKEYTHAEIAQILGRVLGKDVRYKQLTIEELVQRRASGGPPASGQANARTGYGELEQAQPGERKESFFLQHIREVAR